MASILEEKDALREALANFCFRIDSGEADAWCALFTEDGVWEGGPVGTFSGRPELRGFAAGLPEIFGSLPLRHWVSNIIVDVSGDTARLRAYVTLLQTGHDGGPRLLDASSYDIDYVKEDGRWLIRHLRLIHAPEKQDAMKGDP